MNIIYFPNEDKDTRTFLESVFQYNDYDSFNHIMYAGDWNIPLNHELDTSGYLHTNNNESNRYIKSRIVTNDLVDVWRL